MRLARVGVGHRALGLRTLRTALLDGVWISFRRRVSVNIFSAELTNAEDGRFVPLAYKINVSFVYFVQYDGHIVGSHRTLGSEIPVGSNFDV